MTDALDYEEPPPTAREEAAREREEAARDKEGRPRAHQRPVAWLFGRQLVRSLKYTLIYTAFGEKLDPRDWMNPRAFTFAGGGPAAASAASASEGAASVSCPPPWSRRAEGAAAQDEGDFWFDYLSDTGDGTKAVYSLAYLCMSDLWVKDPGGRQPALADSFIEKEEKGGLLKLSRGSFLMVGGDTAYHMSDYATLHERFQLPFQWAFEDLRRNMENAPGGPFDERRRPLFGIPGNHDYYDQLDGFRRQFRRTIRPEPQAEPDPDRIDYRNPQLLLSGFVRCQEASYVALELPHGWWLWGLDTEVGMVDERQKKFFRGLAGEATGLGEREAPAALDRLIVATCAPTTVFGKFPDRDDEKCARAFYQLGLPRPFIEKKNLEPGEPLLGEEQCRLDISGDVHHYARYWGPAEAGAPRVRDGGRPDRRPAPTPNYASVVSGIGGAFHHPSTTYKGEIEEHALWPPEKVSRREVAKQVFRFWNLINGGGVWLVGFLLAFVLYAGLTFSQSSRQFVLSSGVWEGLHLFEQEAVTPTVPVVDQGEVVHQFLAGDWRVPDPPTAGICGRIQPNAPECARGCYPPRYFLGSCAIDKPASYSVGVLLTLLSLGLVVACFILARTGWLFDDPDEKIIKKMQGMPAESEEEARKRRQHEGEQPGRRVWFRERPFVRVAALALPTIAVSLLALLILRPFRPHLTPFGNSMMVLAALIWAAGAVALSVRHSEWLFRKSSVRKLSRWDWAITWVLGVFAVVALTSGLWVFGQNNRAANLVADIVFALVVLAGFLGVVALGYFKAGELRDGYLAKLPYLGLGLVHAVLQMATAFLLVRKGALPFLDVPTPDEASLIVILAYAFARLLVAAAAVLAVVALFGVLGWWLMRSNRRWLLLAAWVAHGAVMLLLPWVMWSLSGRPGGTFTQHWGLLPGFYTEFTWWGLVPALMAGLLGAVLCCVWLGWYFAVALCFHGHNNEIAGAARIERFKQFVRVRVNREGLTGYVIAIDYPRRNGKDLKPRLVDVFHICGKP